MATKKQKRARAEAKHKKFMDEYRLSGLEAQRKDRERRKTLAERAKADAKKRNAETNRRLSTLKALNEMKRESASCEDAEVIDASLNTLSDRDLIDLDPANI